MISVSNQNRLEVSGQTEYGDFWSLIPVSWFYSLNIYYPKSNISFE